MNLEPFGRNTASVAVVAAEWARAIAPDALTLLLPADHVITDPHGFRTVTGKALAAAASEIVTFVIEPNGPEAGYGYIRRGAALDDGVYRVARLVEKPNRKAAEAFLAEGGYAWNAGIFLYSPAVMLSEAERLCPEIKAASVSALDGGAREAPFITLDKTAFAACPLEAIDVAIMEKTDGAAIVPCDIGWADVGSWSELWRQGTGGGGDNYVKGDALVMETEGSLIWTNGPSVAVIGMSDVVVMATPRTCPCFAKRPGAGCEEDRR